MDAAQTTGPRALATQVKPPFMAPAVGTALFGALLAPSVSPVALCLHVVCVASALYVAHLRDEFVDAHVRGEDDPRVAASLLRPAITVTAFVSLVACAALSVVAGPLAAAFALLPLLLGYVHASHLDARTVAGSLDYPVAVGLVLAGGYVAQTGRVPPWLAWPSLSFVALLTGANVSLDRLDRSFDRRIGKRTVPVVLGDARAARVAAGFVALSGVVVLAAVASGALPLPAAVAAAFPFAAAVLCVRAPPERAVRVQMVAAYPFAATLYAATCFGVTCVLARAAGVAP
ncbi:UbiA family prenyltransferase [Halogeometricum sp. S1BR25-6]|uniref:UbiA family prenyltransferase n=1 Tax=Halogeometricum salsisoli TaxID=2950536 RepID=A0ABU2GIN3_9EURY|nr:UbiA family prenyltransferase [Halogeometricum sp. S1BR25-6]MDS0300686.1 UbiA family prenyltransferase [Halogeometricum sp. S1BR25-6]